MTPPTEYPRTLAALAGVERTVWSVVDALVAEVPISNGRVPRGEWPRLMTAIEAAGIVNPSTGAAYSLDWLERLHAVGRWTAESGLGNTLRGYPARVVMVARVKARGDHAKALALLAETPKLHDLAGTSAGGKVTPAQVVAGLRDESTRARVLASPEGLSAVERAGIDAHALGARPTERAEPLPPPPRFASAFWRAVQDVEIAHEQMEKFGLGSLALEPAAREAAERLQRQAAEIAAAVGEAVVENTINQQEV